MIDKTIPLRNKARWLHFEKETKHCRTGDLQYKPHQPDSGCQTAQEKERERVVTTPVLDSWVQQG